MTGTGGGASPWDTARNLDDLAQATIAFLRGELDETPVHGGPPNDETRPLIAALIGLNEAGFVTTDSQPGVVDPDGAQRAYVEGLCSARTADRVIRGLLGTELVVLSFAPETSAWGSIVVTVDDGEPFTFLGRQDPRTSASTSRTGASRWTRRWLRCGRCRCSTRCGDATTSCGRR